ncbi:MAG: DUF1016 N-terminal domain-containing protein [Holophagaceae bacterium]|nr:DUF1016 N-terminal domain-containing protein [Holophagaceae bacterium]
MSQPVDESLLFARVAEIIETRKRTAMASANREVVLMYWEIGQHINSVLLGGKRAGYGKKIFSTLSRKLVDSYGNPFQEENLYRMARLANVFPDRGIVATLKWLNSYERQEGENEPIGLILCTKASRIPLAEQKKKMFCSTSHTTII